MYSPLCLNEVTLFVCNSGLELGTDFIHHATMSVITVRVLYRGWGSRDVLPLKWYCFNNKRGIQYYIFWTQVLGSQIQSQGSYFSEIYGGIPPRRACSTCRQLHASYRKQVPPPHPPPKQKVLYKTMLLTTMHELRERTLYVPYDVTLTDQR